MHDAKRLVENRDAWRDIDGWCEYLSAAWAQFTSRKLVQYSVRYPGDIARQVFGRGQKVIRLINFGDHFEALVPLKSSIEDLAQEFAQDIEASENLNATARESLSASNATKRPVPDYFDPQTAPSSKRIRNEESLTEPAIKGSYDDRLAL